MKTLDKIIGLVSFGFLAFYAGMCVQALNEQKTQNKKCQDCVNEFELFAKSQVEEIKETLSSFPFEKEEP